MPATIELRVVDLAATRALRRAVLRPHETLEQVAAHENPEATAVGAYDDDELVGTGLVAPDSQEGVWRVRGMATAPYARGRGIGVKVLDELVSIAKQNGAKTVWCNARTPALSLYARAGFTPTSDEFEIPEIGPHYVMTLEL